MYISFVALALMENAFFASLDKINGIFIPLNLDILYLIKKKIKFITDITN